MKNIHLIIPFSRLHLKETLVESYRPMGAILHPIMFADEATAFIESWIRPVIIPMTSRECTVTMPGCYKRNYWIRTQPIVDEDYYVTVDDDDSYEPGVFEAVKTMDDDIVIVSMKRGHAVPKDATPIRRYPTDTLYAREEYIQIGGISGQQSFVKGRIFRVHQHNEHSHTWDGELAIHHKESDERIAYRPDLFALFNYYEPGRWTGLKISFGVMVNHIARLDMVLRQSHLDGNMHYVKNPESATKGLNILLDIMEADGADIAVLCHQDMFFRGAWLPQVREQIAKLPDSWVVAGIIGKDMQGRVCGKFQDTRIPLLFNTEEIHTFPHPACCLDECCILVNMHKRFRFDETMDGFHLYGTLCVLQAWEMGGTAWIIDSGAYGCRVSTPAGEIKVDFALAQHHCTLPFTWFPDEQFQRNFKWLHDRFTKAKRLDTTVIGVPKEDATFATSAA